jgi:acyl-CoA thioester hydrolase
MTHEFDLRVFYEDTDLAGIVYYANYLKFIERGRSTLVREAGIDQLKMQEDGLVFAVRKVTAEYFASGKLNDLLTVETSIPTVTGATVTFEQRVMRKEKILFSADVLVTCINEQGKAARIPAEIRQIFQDFSA